MERFAISRESQNKRIDGKEKKEKKYEKMVSSFSLVQLRKEKEGGKKVRMERNRKRERKRDRILFPFVSLRRLQRQSLSLSLS